MKYSYDIDRPQIREWLRTVVHKLSGLLERKQRKSERRGMDSSKEVVRTVHLRIRAGEGATCNTSE